MDDDNITWINGKPYVYDADFDMYRAYVEANEPWTSQWGWLMVIVVLTVICYWVSLPK